ncbi:unnamed protein product [Boreogadus saida]
MTDREEDGTGVTAVTVAVMEKVGAGGGGGGGDFGGRLEALQYHGRGNPLPCRPPLEPIPGPAAPLPFHVHPGAPSF